MIIIYTWKEAPEHYKALSTHEGNEFFVIVGSGNDHLDEIMTIRHTFDTVIERLDVYDHGNGTVHEYDPGGQGEIELVYIVGEPMQESMRKAYMEG